MGRARNRRGGSYTLRLMSNVTNWSGVLLEREILNHLQIGDTVRVIFEDEGTRYIEITNVFPNGYFKGFINDPYIRRRCNICREGETKNNLLYGCTDEKYGENLCDWDCHLNCLKKCPELKTCKCKLTRNKFQNGEKIIFKKNNISEIPNWSKNTERLIERYINKDNFGYRVTGYR